MSNQNNVQKRDLSDDVEAMVEDNDDISQPDTKRIRVETSANNSSDLYLDTVRQTRQVLPHLLSYYFS